MIKEAISLLFSWQSLVLNKQPECLISNNCLNCGVGRAIIQ